MINFWQHFKGNDVNFWSATPLTKDRTRWVDPVGCSTGHRRWVGPLVTLGPTHKVTQRVGPPTQAGSTVGLISEFIKEVSPSLPNPCHIQDYDRSMLHPAQPVFEGCPPKICAHEVSDEDEGEVWCVRSTM